MSLAAAAIAYAKIGLKIFPLAPRSKVPVKGGHGLLDATRDVAEIERIWTENPDYNIGCNCGESQLMVLDADLYKPGAEEALEELLEKIGSLPDTWLSLTGGGGHQYFFSVGHLDFRLRSGTDAIGTGLDRKADGGYVALPPSVHPSGKKYEWELSSTPMNCLLARIPDGLAEMCRKKPAKSNLQDATEPAQRLNDCDQSSPVPNPPDPEHVKSALEAMPADDYTRWVEVGMALKAELGEEGFNPWDSWSQKSDKYNQSEMRGKWDSFRGTGIAAGTLFHYAAEAGWVRPEEGVEWVKQAWWGGAGDYPTGEETRQSQLEDIFNLVYMPDEPPLPPEYLVERILPAGNCAMIIGPPKANKTWLELCIIIACITGGRVLDRWSAKGGCKVMIYCPEGGAENLWRRVFGLCWALRIDPQDVRPHLAMIEGRINISDPPGYQRLRRTIKSFEPNLLAIDPLISVHRGKENSSDEMQPVLDLIRDLQEVHKSMTILLVHHTAKGSEGPRGSSAIDGWWDSKLEVAKCGGGDNAMRKLEVEHRDGAPAGPIFYKLLCGIPENAWHAARGLLTYRLEPG
ncbi:MAG: bifunctional DNA primase/polymerase, partial [Bacteroidetes bacterium]|nr:bifunctional DNA primase/polymerase [Bacteroidota bacterium]